MKKTFLLVLTFVLIMTGSVSAFDSKNSTSSQAEASRDECGYIFGNFDPNPGTVVKFGDAIDFKWDTHSGCSDYELSHETLCFKNTNNAQEVACIGIPFGNHWTLSEGEWNLIDDKMKARTSPNKVDTVWYIQSYYGYEDALKGEILTTEPWGFSYTK